MVFVQSNPLVEGRQCVFKAVIMSRTVRFQEKAGEGAKAKGTEFPTLGNQQNLKLIGRPLFFFIRF